MGKNKEQRDPTTRLAAQAGNGLDRKGILGDAGPTARLAHVDGAQGDGVLKGRNGVAQLTDLQAPALLISYFYLKPFLRDQHKYIYRDWVMDSGAFSAHHSGAEIVLEDFIEKSLELLTNDPTLTEVFALDDLADHGASARNTERMWEAGVPAIPCYHYGEPESVLLEMVARYPKIAIGGCVGRSMKVKMAFAEQVFARAWPKRIHGFGFGSEHSILGLPFHSTDATNWEMGPCAFGRWNHFGDLNVRGSKQDLRKEVEYYLTIEEKARHKWRREMAELAALPDESQGMIAALRGGGGAPGAEGDDPRVRLATDAGSAGGG